MQQMKWFVPLAVGVVLFTAAAAPGLINPNFTPKHLFAESKLIVLARLTLDAKKEFIHATVVEVIKGAKPAKPVSIDLTQSAFEDHIKKARDMVGDLGKQTALVSFGRDEFGKDAGFLHILGKWFRLAAYEGTWDLDQMDAKMEGTWNGSTEMLARCLRYLKAVGLEDAHVPIEGGVQWRQPVKLATLTGKATAIRGVDLTGDGKAAVHVASPGGDLLLVYDAKAAKVVTRKLAARSVVSAWGDLNADGRVDLASFDGKALTLLLQHADGTFAAAPAGGSVALPPDCGGLAVMTLGATGKVALVAAGNRPLVLVSDAKGGLTAVALPKETVSLPAFGKPQAPIVADLTDDGIPDLLQPGETGGILYVGKADGTFAAPVACNVWSGPGGGKPSVADFDGDGWMDIMIAGAERLRIFHNNRDGTFAEVRALSGEVSYKAYATSDGGVCDFNNDGLPDIFTTQPGDSPFFYFNRGFRSFAMAVLVQKELSANLGDLVAGQQAGRFVDLDDDAAEDFIIVTKNGGLWWVPNGLGGGVMALRPRLAAGVGPVSVKAYSEQRLLGVWQVAGGAAPPTIGLRNAGELTLKFRFPGKAEQEETVEVEEGAVGVVLKPAK